MLKIQIDATRLVDLRQLFLYLIHTVVRIQNLLVNRAIIIFIVVEHPLHQPGNLRKPPGQLSVDQPVTVLIRPEAAREIAPLSRSSSVDISRDVSSDLGIQFVGTVRECSFRGGHCRLVVRHESGSELALEVFSDALPLPQPGEMLSLRLRSRAITLLTESTDEPTAAV